ncbi:MAG: septum formation initiator family protein [Terriglobales bacterium]
MDLRLGPPSRVRILPRGEEGLRAAIDQAMGQAREQAPKAEAVAARWVERTRPVWSWLALEWRRLGTAAALLLIMGLLLHAMFGANGMVVYRQKRAEMKALQSQVDQLQKENSEYADQIRSLKSDPAAIEKEAREQLHYTRPGEVVYVAPDPPQKPATGNAKNGK